MILNEFQTTVNYPLDEGLFGPGREPQLEHVQIQVDSGLLHALVHQAYQIGSTVSVRV